MRCSVHFVNNCPLCSKGFSVPSPVVSLELEAEVQAVIAKQTPASTASNVITISSPFLVPPVETVTDPVAVGVLDKAKKYADACQTTRKLEDEVGLLKLQLANATKDLAEAIEIRNAAKKELSKFVE